MKQSRVPRLLRHAVCAALWCVVFCTALGPCRAWAAGALLVPEFSVHHVGEGQGPTLLIVGGIQGDEPGGFSAATLLVTHYSVEHGNLWVVPNTNFPSIIMRSREHYGDMNRKFAYISPQDPDYPAITRIQGLITDPEVRLVLNLHDGSGFYRPTHQDSLRNPRRWGQCVIIDQSELPGAEFSDLEAMAAKAVEDVNTALIASGHRYYLKNTHTADGDVEMEKTLTYFAIRHLKPAFGIEASKELSVELRVFYHLNAIESFMRQMGMRYSRNFEFTPAGVRSALNENVQVAFEDRIVLPLEDVRPVINFLPMPRDGQVSVSSSKPILAVVGGGQAYKVHYGNNTLTTIRPEWREYDYSLRSFTVEADGESVAVPPGAILPVTESFLVHSQPGYRINIIGYQGKNASECGELIRRADILPRFSLDRSATTFRVEAYKGESFSGMFLVRFGSGGQALRPILPAIIGEENEFGR